MIREELTARQRQFYDYIRTFITTKGYAPSIREIQAAFHLKSTKGVKYHTDKLVEKGYLNRENGSARSLSLPFKPLDKKTTAPIVGSVAAGVPVLATENRIGQLPLPEKYYGTDGIFWLKVRGDSMVDEGILDGDFVLVLPMPLVDDGSIAVVLVGEDATVKRFFHRGETIRLVPANPTYATMEFHGPDCRDISIVGKVVSLYRFIR